MFSYYELRFDAKLRFNKKSVQKVNEKNMNRKANE